MSEFNPIVLLAGVVVGAAPILLAAIGETLTEKAGVINLSLDGTILLSAMAAFAVSFNSCSLWLGFGTGAVVGAAVAALVALFSIHLGQSQVAVGFVLTLMTRDLAYFLGNAYARQSGPQTIPMPIPGLEALPVLGPRIFQHPLPIYLSLLSIVACWWYLYHTAAGLSLMAVGENPAAAFARGISPARVQFWYTVMGGVLVGLAGATFSLCVKPGWGRPQGAEGTGWIALALVIFGGWHALRVAFGAYLFAFLQVMGIYFQGWFPSVPAQVFQVAPFPLMIFTLLLISALQRDAVQRKLARSPGWRRVLQVLAGRAPEALGRPYVAQ